MTLAAFTRPQSALKDFDPRQKFLSLYPNRIKSILRPPGVRAWTTLSKHWPLSDETILNAIDGKESGIWGTRWGDETRFAVLDVDKNSKYRSDLELAKLQEKLAAVGLIATPYRSSESGGWHLYIFFDEWARSDEVRQYLADWLKAQGYEIRNGTLEVYPSGMGLRLPLQPGFAWLDRNGQLIRTREELTTDEALASFIFDLENNKRSWSEAKNHIQAQWEAVDRAKRSDVLAHEKAIDIDGFEKLFNYRLIPEKYQDGRRYWKEGLTATGQRHDAILAVEHYLWHGDEAAGVPALPAEHNDEPRYRLILAWLEAKHNGFCNHINRGNWRKVEAQIRRAVKWRRPSGAVQVQTPYPLTENAIEVLIARSKATGRTWTMDDLKKGNDGREEEARKKINEAAQLLTDQGRRVTGRQLMRLTGCSYHTVRRHSDIWTISPAVPLPRAAGDQNPFLVPIVPCVPAPGASGPGPHSEVDFLLCVVQSNSGDLDVPEAVGSEELAPIVLTPPFLLPGWKPTSEPPASSPSPTGAFGSLDAGALVRRYSGRAADGAGGLEPSRNQTDHFCRRWRRSVTASSRKVTRSTKSGAFSCAESSINFSWTHCRSKAPTGMFCLSAASRTAKTVSASARNCNTPLSAMRWRASCFSSACAFCNCLAFSLAIFPVLFKELPVLRRDSLSVEDIDLISGAVTKSDLQKALSEGVSNNHLASFIRLVDSEVTDHGALQDFIDHLERDTVAIQAIEVVADDAHSRHSPLCTTSVYFKFVVQASDSGVYGQPAYSFEASRNRCPRQNSAWLMPLAQPFGQCRYERHRKKLLWIRVNIPQDRRLRSLDYCDVRGPPFPLTQMQRCSDSCWHRIWCNKYNECARQNLP